LFVLSQTVVLLFSKSSRVRNSGQLEELDFRLNRPSITRAIAISSINILSFIVDLFQVKNLKSVAIHENKFAGSSAVADNILLF
jgi:hypothetical protein